MEGADEQVMGWIARIRDEVTGANVPEWKREYENRVFKRMTLGLFLPVGVFASIVSFVNGGFEAVVGFWLIMLVCAVISVAITGYVWWLMMRD